MPLDMSRLTIRFVNIIGRRFGVYIVLGAIAVVTGCSTGTHTRLMHFFFEYPEPSSSSSPEHEATPSSEASSQQPLSESPSQPAATIAGSRHPPFVRRQCQQCHVNKMSQAPREDFMTACKTCHAERFKPTRFGHAPVIAGACRFCHAMHTSSQLHLLKAAQPVLCTSCHAVSFDDKAKTSYHRGIAGMDCTGCHDPHLADNHFLLKPVEQRVSIPSQPSPGV